ncbi:MAG: L,D-transpeptidase [Bacillota bacterium]|nr:L,D-transpeptidase [Bacillota bacterium]
MKKIILPSISMLIIAVSLFAYFNINFLKYGYNFQKGNVFFAQKNYGSALKSYKEASYFKNNSDIEDKIKVSSKLYEDEIKYNSAINFMKNKEYNKAIDIFKSIKNFEDANNKIQECISMVSSENIIEAKKYIDKLNFQQAKIILQRVLSSDSQNIEAKNLMESCDYSIQGQIHESKSKDLLKKIRGVYKLFVDLEYQHVYIYKNNKLIKTMVCSSGMAGYETPEGKFKITGRGNYFFSDKYGEGAYYWVRFYGSYLFHSIPCDKSGNIVQSEADKLGTKASHGCVRLSMEDAKWIYENIPNNISRVLVY